jgi:hypothetical protein
MATWVLRVFFRAGYGCAGKRTPPADQAGIGGLDSDMAIFIFALSLIFTRYSLYIHSIISDAATKY